MEKQYIGDGAYVDFDGWNIILTTEIGIRTTNVIFLEPQVVESLLRYIERLKEEVSGTNKNIPL